MKLRYETYKNLHNGQWSIRDRKLNKVVSHLGKLVVFDAKFVVQPAGRNRVLREQVKNVHAFVRGPLFAPCSVNDIWYDRYPCIHEQKGKSVLTADEKYFDRFMGLYPEWEYFPIRLGQLQLVDIRRKAMLTSFNIDISKCKRVRYDPYENDSFVTVEDNQPIFSARLVELLYDGTVWVYPTIEEK